MRIEEEQPRNRGFSLSRFLCTREKYHWRLVEKYTWRTGVIVFVLGFVFLGLDYLIHPEAGKFQDQIVQELKSMPLPPNTAETHFESGYQPSKGRAVRTFASSPGIGHVCSFYRSIMINAGWQLVGEDCEYDVEDPKQTLLEFRKGQVTWRIGTAISNSGNSGDAEQKYNGMQKFNMELTWMGRPTLESTPK